MNMLFAAMLCFYTQQWSVEVEKGKNSFLDQGSLAAPAPTATNDADYTKHMSFPRHKHTSDRSSRALRLRQHEQPLSVAT